MCLNLGRGAVSKKPTHPSYLSIPARAELEMPDSSQTRLATRLAVRAIGMYEPHSEEREIGLRTMIREIRAAPGSIPLPG